jgi:hypothetical protein
MTSRGSCYSLFIFAALITSCDAHGRIHHSRLSIQPGAHASAAATSETVAYRQCEEMARLRWGTNSQDMQTPRDFTYHACMFDHGMRNP